MSENQNGPADREAQLLKKLAALPEVLEPERDLWPDLAQRIARAGLPEAGAPSNRVTANNVVELPRRKPRTFKDAARRGRLSMAAALLLALGLGFWLGQQSTPDGGLRIAGGFPESPEPSALSLAPRPQGLQPVALQAPLPRNAMSDAEAALIALKLELRASLALHREALPAPTVRSIDDNLRTIDQAILELQRAIEANPQSTELRRALLTYHENEIALLERVTRAASRL